MKYMQIAIQESLISGWLGFIPIGAVLTYKGKLVFKGHNQGRFEHIEHIIIKYIFSEKKSALKRSFLLLQSNIILSH